VRQFEALAVSGRIKVGSRLGEREHPRLALGCRPRKKHLGGMDVALGGLRLEWPAFICTYTKGLPAAAS